jgi:hypothetical protein
MAINIETLRQIGLCGQNIPRFVEALDLLTQQLADLSIDRQ